MTIDVKLLTFTPDAAKVVAAAAKLCYSSSGAADLFNELDNNKAENRIPL